MMSASSTPSPEQSTTAPTPTPSPKRSWGLTLLWLAPVICLLCMLVYGLLTRKTADPNNTVPRVGQPMADFTLPDLQGKNVQLSALHGKVVFINVWATWCPPCVEEMPTIQRLHERLHARGLVVLAVSLDALGMQVVAPFMRDYRLTFPALLDTKGTIERLYRTGGVPESFIVDKQGRLVEKIVGPRNWTDPHILATFERLLAAPAVEAGRHN